LQEIDDGMRSKNVKKRALASVALEIGPNIKIGVKFYVLARQATPASGGFLDKKNNETLTTMTQWVCASTGDVLEPYQISKYFPYGGSKVLFKPEEMTTIRTFGDPGLTLMGFKPRDSLEDYYQYKSGYFLFPDEKQVKGSNVAFNALVQQMAAMNVVGHARMIYRKSSGPRFVALLPQVEELDEEGRQVTPIGMHLVFLPYAEDIRDVKVDAGPTATLAAVNAAKAFMSTELNPDLKLRISADFEPVKLPFENPSLQQHYKVLQCLALEEDLSKDEDGKEELKPDTKVFEEYKDLMIAFNTAIDEIDLPEPAAKKGTKRKASGAAAAGGEKKSRAPEGVTLSPAYSTLGCTHHALSHARPLSCALFLSLSPSVPPFYQGDVNSIDWKDCAEKGTLEKCTIPQLKMYCKHHKLGLGGKKADLVTRIQEHLEG
jgi:ATP-dependent DNA helicase 2 subunit 1